MWGGWRVWSRAVCIKLARGVRLYNSLLNFLWGCSGAYINEAFARCMPEFPLALV